MIKHIIKIMILMVPSLAFADLCNTHLICSANQSCSCIAESEPHLQRNFFLDVTNLEKNNIYNCNINSDYGVRMLSVTVPEGATEVCNSKTCDWSPASYLLTTKDSAMNVGTATFEVMVPEYRDMPTNISISCTLVTK